MADTREGSYEVAAGTRAIYIRVHGLASMNNCLCLRDFIEKMFAAGHTFLVIDLADCAGMDSTFMGLLAAAAQYEWGSRHTGVAVVNARNNLVKLLKSVGITELVFIEREDHEAPAMEFVRLKEQASEEERLALVRWAHEHLTKISKRNEKLFGPFLAELETDMQQHGFNGK